MPMEDWLSVFELYSQDGEDTIIDMESFVMEGHKMVHKQTNDVIYWISYSVKEPKQENSVLLMSFFFPEEDYKKIRQCLVRGEHPADVLKPYGKLPSYAADDLSKIYTGWDE